MSETCLKVAPLRVSVKLNLLFLTFLCLDQYLISTECTKATSQVIRNLLLLSTALVIGIYIYVYIYIFYIYPGLILAVLHMYSK